MTIKEWMHEWARYEDKKPQSIIKPESDAPENIKIQYQAAMTDPRRI